MKPEFPQQQARARGILPPHSFVAQHEPRLYWQDGLASN
jgi:hypothetical protein